MARTNPRHLGYRLLLANGLTVIGCLMLPAGMRQVSALGYLAMPWVLLFSLGARVEPGRWSLQRTRAYRLLAVLTFASSLGWYFASAMESRAGFPLLFLWTLLVGWSCERLIRNLAKERAISRDVLMGALAGYLLVGLAAGLLFAVLESLAPGSFVNTVATDVSLLHGAAGPAAKIFSLDFAELNYYAFITLTTTGYGDISPVTPQSQMLSVLVAVSGTVYLALVMGLLISRYTVQDVEEEIAEELEDS